MTTDALKLTINLTGTPRSCWNALIDRLPTLSKSQKSNIKHVADNAIRNDGYGDDYEISEFTVTVLFGSSFEGRIHLYENPPVTIYSEVRLSTPGTYGHMWPVRRRLVIGKRGGMRCVNAARFTGKEDNLKRVSAADVRGSEALYCITESY